jgi:uncharacterized protein involved in exopolysaccharide biosynthesis
MNEKKEQQQQSLYEWILSLSITLKPYVKKAWMHRKQLLFFNGFIVIFSLLILFFLVKPYYQSKIIILPDFGNKNSDMLSQFAGLASLAGVNVNDNPATLLYQDLIMSETVIAEAVYKQYQTEAYVHPVNLIQYFELKPDKSLSDSLRNRKMFLIMYKMLTKDLLQADFDRQTRILSVIVEMPESKLSADVANALVLSLDKYVRTQRKSFATEQRKYLEVRVKQVKDTLTYCEDQLKIFSEKNRQVLQSPDMQLAQARLMRNVEIQQTIYGELIKQLELVKLQEIKDTPVVNVCEYAKEPIIKAGPKRVIIMIFIFFLSLFLSIGWLLIKENINDLRIQIRKS